MPAKIGSGDRLDYQIRRAISQNKEDENSDSTELAEVLPAIVFRLYVISSIAADEDDFLGRIRQGWAMVTLFLRGPPKILIIRR
jgi:hypothetical protein